MKTGINRFPLSGWPRRVAAIGLLCATAACGGKDGNPGGGTTPDPIPAPNGSRLAWNQRASSVQQLQALAFRLYVDGALSSMSAVTCGTAASNGEYECSGRLPAMSAGRHVLELSAVQNSVEGPRSSSLAVIIGAAAEAPAAAPSLSGDVPSPTSVCVTTADCYEIQTIASGLESASSLAQTSDGRLYFIEHFIEGGSQVRIIERGTLKAEPALSSADVPGRLTGLAVDPGDPRWVFVAWSQQTPGGATALSVTRYREVGGTFGEGATIVTGLPGRENAASPMAIGLDGLLYIALPSTRISSGAIASPSADETGKIVRLTRDGFVPDVNRGGSPVIAIGYATPTAMAGDPGGTHIWTAGSDGGFSPGVSALPVSATNSFLGGRMQPRLTTPATSKSALGLLTATREEGPPWLLIGTDQQLLRGIAAADGTLSGVMAVPADVLRGAQTVAGTQSTWYVAAAPGDGTTSIFRLEKR